MEKQIFNILSIEDNEPDFVLLQKALNRIDGIKLNIINISNGKKALDFIYKRNEFKFAVTPDIIILDINLPLISGKDILKDLKKDENYRVIPIIIFSTSNSYSDIEECYKLYANSYITKTFDIKELFNKIAIVGEYWLKMSEIPSTTYFIGNIDKE
jgi:CheY-like chemotaxis protein